MKKKMFACVGVSILLCTACAPTEYRIDQDADYLTIQEQLKSTSPNEVPEHVKLTIAEDIEMDADIFLPDNLKEYKLQDMYFTRKMYSDTEKKKIAKELSEQFQQEVINETTYEVNELENGKEEKVYRIDFQGKDNTSILVGECMLWMLIGDFHKLDIIYGNQTISNSLHWNYEKDRELNFATVQKAKEEFLKLLQQCDVEVAERIDCYSLDAATMQKIYEEQDKGFMEINNAGDYSYGTEDEAYALEAYHSYKGIPFYPYETTQNLCKTEQEMRSMCSCYYNREGIIKFTVNYRLEKERAGEEQQIITIGDVMEKNVERLNSVVGMGPIVIKDITLNYLPVLEDGEKMEFHGIPIYSVLYQQKELFQVYGGESYYVWNCKVINYNAYTGEVIYNMTN